ncbi:MAG: hypothetical protein D3911_01090 [Candidatus Electrothrix sp. AW3_4]|nr:hypothetical protein [Candidatus Electrothrix gigas]
MEQLANILQYFKEHPEVTWSGAGLTALAVLYFLITKLFASFFRKKTALPDSNTFTCKGGEQNVAQGEGAIGSQTNIFPQPLKLQTLILVVLLAAVVLGAVLVGWHRRAPKGEETHVSTIGGNAPATVAGHDVTVHYHSGISPEDFARYAGELAVTDAALASFFKILEEQPVPRSDLDAKLREIAARYKELLHEVEAVQSTDPQVVKLKSEAKQAIEEGRYSRAAKLLKDIKERPLNMFKLFIQAELGHPPKDR